jgi:hypothetical protein
LVCTLLLNNQAWHLCKRKALRNTLCQGFIFIGWYENKYFMSGDSHEWIW